MIFPAPAAFVALALAAAPSPLERAESAIRNLDPAPALLALPAGPGHAAAAQDLERTLTDIERDLRERLAALDADPDLLTDPDLRARRSELAVVDLRLRLPIARARLVALDPASTADQLRAALASLDPLDYAWGAPALDRRAAIAALQFRANRFDCALEEIDRASPVDPLATVVRTASFAALERLERPPLDPGRLEIAIAGAAHGPGGLRAAADLARVALTEAPFASLPSARRAALETLSAVAASAPSPPPIVRLARAAQLNDRAQLEALASNDDPLTSAEAQLALHQLEPAAARLARAATLHPNPAARRLAATDLTPRLPELPPAARESATRSLLADLSAHPHADRWRLALAELAPPAEALDLLDRIAEPKLSSPASLLAARRALDRLQDSADPDDARGLLRRLAQTEGQNAPPAWRPFLAAARVEALLALDDIAAAAEAALAAPASARQAAALAAAPLDDRLLEAEAAGDRAAISRLAPIAAKLATRAADPVRAARALVLSGEPEAALAQLDGAPASPAADLARAEALYVLGRDADAFPIYRRLAETAETSGDRSERFWRSWSRLLTIIKRQDATRQRQPEIDREIRRLRIIDDQLGGQPYRRRLEALASPERR
jgi:hypothetical protein